jgi:hypothetical protein
MLVFFIHGVATKDAGYSKRLQVLLKEEFDKRDEPLPHFYGSFWGAVVSNKGKLWNWIHQDLKDLKKEYPQADIRDVFRYQEFREDFISDFFGDILTYCNTDRGRDIREIIADQLYRFLRHHPYDKDLHIVTHSLGSVILWDILFSERFNSDDPAYQIRSMLKSFDYSSQCHKACLKSIITMGSPILFFNMMFDICPEKVKAFAKEFEKDPIRWLNVIHASDVIAYPLQSSMNAKLMPNLFFRDKYIWSDGNGAERTARSFGQAHAAMGLGVSDAHCSYWNSRGVARLVAANILGDCDSINSAILDTQ